MVIRQVGKTSRRRFLSIVAGGAILAFGDKRAEAASGPYRWQGIILGAQADLTLYAEDRGMAAEAVAACLAETKRLEAIFSLYEPHSALVRLNRDGILDTPPAELLELLSLARLLGELSDGRFDPTVQPLWALLAAHFADERGAAEGPSPEDLADARALVDWRRIALAPDRIVLARRGMQVTLNGIAQGYISDRVGAVLKDHGFRQALVNMGEVFVPGPQADGSPWRIAVPSPIDRQRIVATLEIVDGAVATSAGSGMRFDLAGKFNHIIDPTRLLCADPQRSVTVAASSAVVADGLSTLGALLPDLSRDFPPLLKRFSAQAYIIQGGGGEIVQLG